MSNHHYHNMVCKERDCGVEYDASVIENWKYEYEKLVKAVNNQTAFMEEAKKRIIAGGPLALSEYIIVKVTKQADGKERLWLKVIDVTKGYWAEAPLDRNALLMLTMRQDSTLERVTK